jgi:hypothetical protein
VFEAMDLAEYLDVVDGITARLEREARRML